MIWLKELIYGLISGLAACFPVSAAAHREILAVIFGMDKPQPLLHILLDIACLTALLIGCRREWSRLGRDGRHGNDPSKGYRTRRLLRTALLPMILVLLLTGWLGRKISGLSLTSLFLALNGILLLIPQQLPVGNRDARTLSPLAAVLIGMAGGVCGIPGLSGLAAMLCVALVLGAGRQTALNYAYMLSIPAVALQLVFDLTAAAGGIEPLSALVLGRYLLTAAACCAGASLAIMTMRALSVKTGFTGFAFYSWGAAMFALILFLMT